MKKLDYSMSIGSYYGKIGIMLCLLVGLITTGFNGVSTASAQEGCPSHASTYATNAVCAHSGEVATVLSTWSNATGYVIDIFAPGDVSWGGSAVGYMPNSGATPYGSGPAGSGISVPYNSNLHGGLTSNVYACPRNTSTGQYCRCSNSGGSIFLATPSGTPSLTVSGDCNSITLTGAGAYKQITEIYSSPNPTGSPLCSFPASGGSCTLSASAGQAFYAYYRYQGNNGCYGEYYSVYTADGGTTNITMTAPYGTGPIACNGGTTQLVWSADGSTSCNVFLERQSINGTWSNVTSTSGNGSYWLDYQTAKDFPCWRVKQVCSCGDYYSNEICTTVQTSSGGITYVNGTDENCPAGSNDGTITATGSATNYSIDGGVTWQTSGYFTGLAPGTYTVVGMDSNSCETNPYTVTINAASGCTNPCTGFAVYGTGQDATCGSNDGSITVNTTGGNSPVSFSLNGGSYTTNTVFNNLPAGIYVLSAIDNAGCTAQSTNIVISSGCTGGCSQTTPLASWDYNSGNLSTTVPYITQNGCTGVTGSNLSGPGNSLLSGGPSGNAACTQGWTAASFDATTLNVSFSINFPVGDDGQITGFSFWELSPVNRTYNGALNNYPTLWGYRILKNGTEVYRDIDIPTNQSWFHHVFNLAGVPGLNSTVSSDDTYTFEVRAYAPIGNTGTGSYFEFDLFEIFGCCGATQCGITGTATPSPTTCAGDDGSITVTNVSGGVAPYSYSIDGDQTSQASNVFNGLAPGNYNVTIKDNTGCTYEIDNVIVGNGCNSCSGNLPLAVWDNCANLGSGIPASSTNQNGCTNMTAGNLTRGSGGNSCFTGTPSGQAICTSGWTSSSWQDGATNAMTFSVSFAAGDQGTISGFNMWEISPEYRSYNPTQLNNYPTLWGYRILRDGVEVYQQIDIPTNRTWFQHMFNLSGIPALTYNGPVTFEFEFMAYAPVGNGGSGQFFEFDLIELEGCCGSTPPCSILTQVPTSSNPTCASAPAYNDGVINMPAALSLPGGQTVQFSIDGGVTWSNTSTFTGLTAGTYKLQYRYSDGTCLTEGVTIVLVNPTGCDPCDGTDLKLQVTNSTDCDNPNGGIKVQFIGGTGPYQYSLDGGVSFVTSLSATYQWSNLSPGSYHIIVRDANGCEEERFPIKISGPLNCCEQVGNANPITGTTNHCLGTEATFSTTAVANADSYTWSVSSNLSIISGQGGLTILVSFDGVGPYEVCVVPVNECSAGDKACFTGNVITVPNQPNAITGPTSVCEGEDYVYTVSGQLAISGFDWTVPTGWTILNESNNSITVTAGSSSGKVCVTRSNTCGTSTPSCISVTSQSVPNTPGQITGPNKVCAGQDYVYSVSGTVVYLGGYDWTVPSGWTILNESNNSITVTAGSSSGQVCASRSNSCGTSAPSCKTVTVETTPTPIVDITGNLNPCEGTTVEYCIAQIANADSYTWTVPAGYTIVSGQGTHCVNVAIPSGAATGDICVFATNSCGDNATYCEEIDPQVELGNGPTISGPVNPCANTTVQYCISAPTAGASSYSWTYPTGWTQASISKACITLNINSTGGNVCVTPSGPCGTGTPSCLNVDVIDVPTAVTFSGPLSVCSGSPANYSVDNASSTDTYTWTVPTGWTINSGQGTGDLSVTPNGSGGQVCVTPSNACGNGPQTCKNVLVSTVPATPLTINGETEFCLPYSGSTTSVYTAPTSSGVTYNWSGFGGVSVPAGSNGASVTATITGTGKLCLSLTNQCGTSGIKCITIRAEATPFMSGGGTTAESCAGNDGTITVNGSLGVPPYEYNLDGGPWQTSNVFTGLAAGTYTVGVRNSSGNCPAYGTLTVNGPASCCDNVTDAGTIGSDQEYCGCTSPAAFTNIAPASGGFGGAIEYQWQIFQNGTWWNITGANSTTYNYGPIVCTDTQFRRLARRDCLTAWVPSNVITISITEEATISSTPTSDETCAGNDGSITVNATGGVPALLYNIDGGTWGSSNVFSGLTAGTYTVGVANNDESCPSYTNVTIQGPASCCTNVTDPGTIAGLQSGCGCFDPNPFTNVVAASGGSGGTGVEYQWQVNTGSGWVNIPGATGLTYDAGQVCESAQYRRRAKQSCANTWLNSSPISITVKPEPSITSTPVVDETCAGGDGSITVNATGGTPILQYNIDGGTWGSSNVFAGLTAGTYTVGVRNIDGSCPVYAAVTVAGPTTCCDNISDAGTIGSDQEHCGCTSPEAFSSIAPATGGFGGSVEYQWQILQNGTWATILGATGATYNYSPIVCEDTQFRRLAKRSCTTEWVPSNVITITITPEPTINSTPTVDETCAGNDGSITVNATGGVPALLYSIDGGAWQTSNVFSGLTAGTYSVAVANNDQGCPDYMNVTITGPATCCTSITNPGSIASNQTNCGCFDPAAFTSTSPASGGSGGSIEYQWQVFSNGFWVPIIGATNSTYNPGQICETTEYRRRAKRTCDNTWLNSNVVTITVIEEPVITSTPVSEETCAGNDGSITVNATGGVPALLYNIDGGTWQSSNAFSGLAAGTYSIGVTNNDNSCPVYTTVTVNGPANCCTNITDAGSIGTNQQSCGCFDPASFTSITPASGGSGGSGVEYQWQVLQSNGVWTNISGATNATFDANQVCVTTQYRRLAKQSCANAWLNSNPVTVTVLEQPVIASTPTVDETCAGNDGSITVNATGGTGPLLYNIDGGPWQTSNVFSGLAAGTYLIKVTNNDGTCTDDTTVTIDGPTTCCSNITSPGTISGTQSECGCFDPTTLTSTSPASGGFGGSVEYQWQILTSGGTWTDIPGATSSTYDPALTCESVRYRRKAKRTCATTWLNSLSITIKVVPEASITAVTPTDESCAGNDGTVTITATGGSAPLEYNLDGGPWQTSNVFINLTAGTYTVGVSNSNGNACPSYQEVTVLPASNCCTNITDAGSIGADQEHCGCYDPTTLFSTAPASGGNGGNIVYQWQINNGAGWVDVNGATGTSFDPDQICSTTQYRRLAKRDCMPTQPWIYSNEVTVTVNPNPSILNVDMEDETCVGTDGSITINAQGGQGILEYSIDGVIWTTDNSFTGLAAGTYTVYVRNQDHGCQVSEDVVINLDTTNAPTAEIVMTPQQSNVCNGTTALFQVSNPQPGVSYSWNFGPDATPQTANVAGPISVSYSLASNSVLNSVNNVTLNATLGSCSDNDNTSITVRSDLTNFVSSANGTDPSNCGDSDGSINVVFNPPATVCAQYRLVNVTGWQTSPVFNNLPAGSYQLEVGYCEDPTCGNVYGTVIKLTDPSANMADISAAPTELCVNEQGTFSATTMPGATYSWDFGPGAFPATSNAPTQSVTYSTGGSKLVSLTVTINGCTSTDDVTVEVNEDFISGGLIGSDESGCGAYNPSLIVSVLPPSGGVGSGATEYQWQMNTGSGWMDIAGAVMSTYDPVVISGTTMYRRLSRRSSCTNWAISNAVTKTVISDLADGGIISGDESQCGAYDPAAIAGITNPTHSNPGTVDITYQWQVSLDGVTWVDVPGGTGVNLDPGQTIVQTTYFRRLAFINPCNNPVASNTVVKEVISNVLNGGSIAADQSACGSLDVAELTNVALPTGNVGGTVEYQWEVSQDGGNTWAIISGSNSPTLDPGVVTTTTMYRRGARVAPCTAYVYSNAVTITISPLPGISTVFDENPTCLEGGSIYISTLGGPANYDFSIDGGVTWITGQNTFDNLPAGNYNIIIRETVNPICQTSYGLNPVVLTAPVPPTVAFVNTTAESSCGAGDGSMNIVLGTLGTAPYGVTYDFGGNTIVGGTFASSPMLISGLTPGTYTNITIVDSEGCTVVESAVVISGANCNNPPEPVDDFNNTVQGQPTTGVLTTNDSDPDGDPITVTGISSTPGGPYTNTITIPGQGVWVLGPNGTYTFTPDPNFVGTTDPVYYEICDDQGACEEAVLTIEVLDDPTSGFNQPPVANNDHYESPFNTQVTGNVLPNDFDPDGDPICIQGTMPQILTTTGGGTVVLNTDGAFVYTPAANFTGLDSTSYTICDGPCGAAPISGCDEAVLTIEVLEDNGATNNPPFATDDGYNGPMDNPITGNVSDNDPGDPDGDPVVFTQISNPTFGTVTSFDPVTGDFTYVPNPGYYGPDQFIYQVCDGISGCDFATVYITIMPPLPNDPPEAINDYNNTLVDTPVDGNISTNDSDPDGDPLTIAGISDDPNGPFTNTQSIPGQGTVVITDPTTGEYTFTPDPGFVGTTDPFYYVTCDPAGLCDTAILVIEVLDDGLGGNNQPPVANDDNYETPFGTNVTGSVLPNDFDPDADPICLQPLAFPTITANGGQVFMSADGSFVYIPDAGFSGEDSFTYTICDGDCTTPISGCDEATVTITVGEPDGATNNPPDAVDDGYNTPMDTDITGNVADNDPADPDGDTPLTYSVVTGPSNGTITSFDPTTGDFTYDPSTGYSGPDQFTYEVCDGISGCDIATVYITIMPGEENNPPEAINDYNNTLVDTPVDGNISTNDSDPDGDPLTVTGISDDPNGPFTNTVTIPGQGTVVLTDPTTGEYTFTPDPGFVGTTDPVYYVTCDPAGLCDTAILVIEVLDDGIGGNNQPPVANDDNYETPFGTNVTGSVLPNDFDPDGDVLCLDPFPFGGFTANGGQVFMNADGIFTYIPDAGFSGEDSFTYTICDGDCTTPISGCDEATVTITVGEPDGATNNPPDAVDDGYNTPMDTDITGNVADNDPADPDGDTPLTYSVVTGPGNGTITSFDPTTGDFTYDPSTGYSGPDQFTYEVCDGISGCDIATVYITVMPGEENLPPVAINDFNNTLEDVNVTGNVTINDNDPENDPLTVQGFSTTPTGTMNPTVTIPGQGTITLDDPTTGDYTFDPEPGFVGTTDPFYYVTCDAVSGGCDTAYVIIEVLDDGIGTNEPPVANDDNYETPFETNVTGNVLPNDFDPDGDDLCLEAPASFPILTANGGQVFLNTDGTFIYIPDAGFSGEDEFTYTICDGDCTTPISGCDDATVTITVGEEDDATNNPPDAVDDSYNAPEDTPITANVADNDPADPDGDTPLTYAVVDQPTDGTITSFDPTTGDFVYTPDLGYNGPDQFTYEVCDGISGCDTATVYITIMPTEGNLPPEAINDYNNTLEDTPVSGNVTTNDSDPENDPLTVQGFNTTPTGTMNPTATIPGQGTITLDDPTTGDYTFVPETGFTGTTDPFYYVTCDAVSGGCDTAIVVIEILEDDPTTNDPPVANDDNYETPYETPVNGSVLPNDFDPDGDALCLDPFPFGGMTANDGLVFMSADGSFVYIPANGFSGEDSFTYTICDDDCTTPTSGCDDATVTITVGEPSSETNLPPDAVDDSYNTPMDTPVTDNVMLNDPADPDGDTPLTYAVVDQPTDGTLTSFDPATGDFTYDPNTGYTGPDQFTYEVCDGISGCDTATVYITIMPVEPNLPPEAINDYNNTLVDVNVSGNVTTNDSDPEDDPLTVEGFSTTSTGTMNPTATIPGQGTITLDDPATGDYTFDPEPGFVGTTDPFYYVTCDGISGCDTAIVVIEILDDDPLTNDPPVANDDNYETPHNTPVAGSILPNDFDPDDDALCFDPTAISATTEGGMVFMNADGTFIYVPPVGFSGEDSFTYTICDDDCTTPTSGCDDATVTITVDEPSTEANLPPDAVDDAYNTPVNTEVTDNVTINDPLDPDGDTPLMYAVVDQPTNGTVTSFDPVTGDFTYDPTTDYTGPDQFTYEVCDGISGCDTATVYITIMPGETNLPPVAINDFNNTPQDVNVQGSSSPNDWDPEGDPFTVSGYSLTPGGPYTNSVTIPGEGTLTLLDPVTGLYEFDPEPAFTGTTTPVEYEICDMTGCAIAYIEIEVISTDNSSNLPPIANNDHYQAPINTPVTSNVMPNDFDPDADPITLTVPPGGALFTTSGNPVIIDADGNFTWVPTTDYVGLDSFYYEICDGISGCDDALVTILVGADDDPINNPPRATDDAYLTSEDVSITANVTANDPNPADPDNDPVTYEQVSNPANGTVTAFDPATGLFTYMPNSGFIGNDEFLYTVCDGISGCDTAVVIITILPSKCIDISLYVYLEGALIDPGTQVWTTPMRTDLNNLRQLLPGQTPVNPLVPPTPAGNPYRGAPWNYTGTALEETYAGPYDATVVDWLLITIRKDITPDPATDIKANALLHEDGRVEFLEPCILKAGHADSVYIMVEHRNHMGILTDTALTIESTTNLIVHDFRPRDSYRVTGFGQKPLPLPAPATPDFWAMYGGDGDQSDFPSYDINSSDEIFWLNRNGIFDTYNNADYTLDGDVNTNDQLLWDRNQGVSSIVPKNP